MMLPGTTIIYNDGILLYSYHDTFYYSCVIWCHNDRPYSSNKVNSIGMYSEVRRIMYVVDGYIWTYTS